MSLLLRLGRPLLKIDFIGQSKSSFHFQCCCSYLVLHTFSPPSFFYQSWGWFGLRFWVESFMGKNFVQNTSEQKSYGKVTVFDNKNGKTNSRACCNFSVQEVTYCYNFWSVFIITEKYKPVLSYSFLIGIALFSLLFSVNAREKLQLPFFVL